MRKHLIYLLLAACTLSGCQSSFGPNALQTTHPAYNQAIIRSLNEQMLLNLVRLRYRDQPYFLKVNSVTAALTFDGSIGVGSELDLAPGGNIIQPNLGIAYSDKPTISFQPLQGEDFLKSVLSSVSFDALLVMTQSGWSIERVFGLCVERINDVFNAPSASGPSPAVEPEFKGFKRALKLIRQLQLAGEMEIGPDQDNRLNVLFKVTADNKEKIAELSDLLGFRKPGPEPSLRVALDNNFLHAQDNELKIRTRSISGVLFYLSQQVDIPRLHAKTGLVTVTRTRQGEAFDWKATPAGELFRVRYADQYPERAFLAVPYRNFWFYIADNDLETKSTFMLLTQLFDLQAGQNRYSGPTLTLPVR